jgi:hypothetical protein
MVRLCLFFLLSEPLLNIMFFTLNLNVCYFDFHDFPNYTLIRNFYLSHTFERLLGMKTKVQHLCFVCFGVKCFLKNIFGIFWCLVGTKIMVNENHFQFDRKIFFNF